MYNVKRLSEKGVSNMEINYMTNAQFKGIIQMIIALLEKDTPNEDMIKYLRELIKDNTDNN